MTTQNRNNGFRDKVKRADRNARRVITLGGYTIILSIVAIFLFLIYQSLPLSYGASISSMFSFQNTAQSNKAKLTGIDSYLEVYYEVMEDGTVICFNSQNKKEILRTTLNLDSNETILSTTKGSIGKEQFAVGTDKGRIISAEIKFRALYLESGRQIKPVFKITDRWQAAQIDTIPNHIEQLTYAQNEDGSSVWSWLDHSGNVQVRIEDLDMDETYNYTLSDISAIGKVSALQLSSNAEQLIITSANGEVIWYDFSDFEELELRDQFSAGDAITSVSFLLGDQAIVIGTNNGSVSLWFPIRTESNLFKFRKIHEFTAHKSAVNHIYVSPRNRNFLTIDKQGAAKLHYSTSGQTELEFSASDHPVTAGAFAPKSNAILLIDSQNSFALYALDNPHPESGLNTLFGTVWYEGYKEAEFVWQSTGGSDEFEPKLSLIPLIFGTLKGTLFAMLFSVPLALFAAIYVAQFAPKSLANTIKPIVEIMAALPSVVIGFLAGLYFAPFFEKYIITTILFVLLLPALFYLFITVFQRIPEHKRAKLPAGFEIYLSVPVALVTVLIALGFDSGFENILFAGNFQQWFYETFEVAYETRNSVVVGFALGFAVIPIIFTVSEDALSNVPKSLSSASLALGASPWQTLRRVVLPAASGGIFAAIMLGLGRAVGETMIVLMATGNTPVLDINPFNGFRAMSACIAVEIPEAPVGGTLYRILFLTGLLLFLFTFVLNTLSSAIGERLRKKYARF